ncbi:hypothetical protein [Kribbella sp. CA-293567]|uniref:hypothetical protein n=1 Tax=Kribbella sp. CA-293567 TaxID=3002436 RepID=UPI0022DE06D9|nr:hypothetical protein [Kribbella sp. CA-293567]WBQ04707.1 hypothetical protein OX958_32695 [Kribbella sp. CA-293567]
MRQTTVRKAISITGATVLGISGVILVNPAATAAVPSAQHCVGSADRVGQQCFGTLDEALGQARKQVATKGPLQAQGEVIQGTFFDNRDYGGDSFTVTGAGLCDGSDGVINYQFTFPPEWHNRISSVQPWASCKIWLYPEADLNGDRDGPFKVNTGWIGTMLDDRTVSVGFS